MQPNELCLLKISNVIPLIEMGFAGQVKEFGPPTFLLEQPSSLFKSLVTEYCRRSRSPNNEVM